MPENNGIKHKTRTSFVLTSIIPIICSIIIITAVFFPWLEADIELSSSVRETSEAKMSYSGLDIAQLDPTKDDIAGYFSDLVRLSPFLFILLGAIILALLVGGVFLKEKINKPYIFIILFLLLTSLAVITFFDIYKANIKVEVTTSFGVIPVGSEEVNYVTGYGIYIIILGGLISLVSIIIGSIYEKDYKFLRLDTPKSKKLAAVATVIVILIPMSVYIWDEHYQPITIRELAIDIIDSNNFNESSPTFREDLAGGKLVVEGTITNITTYNTTLGELNIIELDNYEYLHLVFWGSIDYKVDDRITEDIYFEWGRCNEQVGIYSPQLDFPNQVTLPAIEVVMSSISWTSGIGLTSNQNTDGSVNISVSYIDGTFPLMNISCYVRAGKYSFALEYIDVSGGYKDSPNIDTIHDLTHPIGENGSITYYDANNNQLLDIGDYFIIQNLTKPEEDEGFLTYLFGIKEIISDYIWPEGLQYIIMTKNGLYRIIE